MLDRYLLRYFLAVVDQGNFSRAAEHCHVSQPTLSVGIAKLERTLGTRLLVRSSQRVELTDAGARFLIHARRIEQDFLAAQQAVGTGGSERPALRIGVLTSIPVARVAQGIAAARPGQDHRFELLFGNERALITHLGKGRIDLALTLVERGSDRFRERAVLTEAYGVTLSQAHPLAGREEVAAEQLAGEVMIVRRHCEALADTSRFFTERGVRPHFALRSTSDERVLPMVAAGLGLTVMPQSYRFPGVAWLRLAGFRARRTIGWLAGHDAESLLDARPAVLDAIEAALVEG